MIEAGVRQASLDGRAVCLHASYRSLRETVEAPESVIEAFLEAGCTLLVPTFSWGEYAVAAPSRQKPERNAARGFPVRRSRAAVYEPASRAIDEKSMGAVATSLVQYPGRVRGNHPLVSFTAVGPDAAALVGPQTPLRPFEPLRALVDHDGVVVLAGVGLESCTLLHLAEQEAGRNPFVRWAEGASGPMEVAVGGCSNGFDRLEPALRQQLRHIQVGPSRWLVFDAAAALATATQAIRDHPEITRCPQPDCARCDDAIAGGPLV